MLEGRGKERGEWRGGGGGETEIQAGWERNVGDKEMEGKKRQKEWRKLFEKETEGEKRGDWGTAEEGHQREECWGEEHGRRKRKGRTGEK